jgi:hypothetical protein
VRTAFPRIAQKQDCQQRIDKHQVLDCVTALLAAITYDSRT